MIHARGMPESAAWISLREMGVKEVEEVRSEKPEWRRCARRHAC
jgi:hypothetical protein